MGKGLNRRHFEIFFLLVPRKQDLTFHANYLLEKICMKCQILFSGKNKNNITYLSSAEVAHRVLSVNTDNITCIASDYICLRSKPSFNMVNLKTTDK